MNLLEFSAGYEVPGPAGVGKVGEPPGPDAEYVEGEPAVSLDDVHARPRLVSRPAEKNGPGPNDVVATRKNGEKPEPPVENATLQAAGDWMLELQDGTTLSGQYEAEVIEFETGTSSLKLKPEQVESMTFGFTMSLDKLVTQAGKQKSGLLLSTPVKFRTARGVEEFEKEDLVRLFRAPKPEKESN